MFDRLIIILFRLIHATGIHRLFSRIYGGSGTIITLHRVMPEAPSALHLPPTKTSIITPEYLHDIISEFRKKGYSFISIDDIPKVLPKGGEKFVVLSFDDGYRDIIEFAYPVLKAQSIPFTIFVTSGFADRSGFIWWEAIDDILLNQKKLILQQKGSVLEYDINDRNRNELFSLARSVILRYSEKELNRYEQEFSDYYGIETKTYAEKLILSWKELKACSRDPLCTIGAHSVNHLAMKFLSDDEVRKEISESRHAIEKALNMKINHFAFPYGGPDTVTKRDIEIARSEGFNTVCTTRRANLFPDHVNYLYALPRIHIAGGDKMNLVRQVLWFSGLLPAVKYRGKRIITA